MCECIAKWKYLLYIQTVPIHLNTKIWLLWWHWIRIHLPTQWTLIWSLVWKDSTYHRATKPMHHNYWAPDLETAYRSCWSPCTRSLCSTRRRMHTTIKSSPCSLQLEKAHTATKTRHNSIHFSCSVVSDSLRPHGSQHARHPCPSPTPRVYPNSCPLSRWCHPTISSSVSPLSSCLQSFPASGSFQWVSSSHQVAKVLELQLQHQSFQWIFRTDFLQHWLVGSPCSPRDSQALSPKPQFKSINSSVVSFLYSPTHIQQDHWKNHSFD